MNINHWDLRMSAPIAQILLLLKLSSDAEAASTWSVGTPDAFPTDTKTTTLKLEKNTLVKLTKASVSVYLV